MKYNRFADLGNVKPAYRETFNKLFGLRDCARYLKGEVEISKDEAHSLLNVVKKMLEDALHWIDIQ